MDDTNACSTAEKHASSVSEPVESPTRVEDIRKKNFGGDTLAEFSPNLSRDDLD